MSSTINPFSVKTPETLSPEDIASLFVDVFSDYPKLLHKKKNLIQENIQLNVLDKFEGVTFALLTIQQTLHPSLRLHL
ncbi:hypothetical protein QO226_22730, partial [Vibrio vulnificus]|uniref:hypothetical protein n=1 Tax=Vibrio vulnificus TaxID=672 RepID=UPI0024DF77BC